MKQSKSANHNMNGDTTVAPNQDAKRSMSMEATLTSTDDRRADGSVADNCVAPNHAEAAINNTAPVEPPSPSSSSTVTVVSVVHADNEGKRQKPGTEST